MLSFLPSTPNTRCYFQDLRICVWFLYLLFLPMVTWISHSLSFIQSQLSLKEAVTPFGWKKSTLVGEQWGDLVSFLQYGLFDVHGKVFWHPRASFYPRINRDINASLSFGKLCCLLVKEVYNISPCCFYQCYCWRFHMHFREQENKCTLTLDPKDCL